MQLLDEVYINDICSATLLESKADRYFPMFQKYINLGWFEAGSVKDWIKYAVRVLSRDDCIAYFLNWYRVQQLRQIYPYYQGDVKDQVAKAYEEEKTALIKKTGLNDLTIRNNLSTFDPLGFLQTIERYFNYGIPKILTYEWKLTQAPDELLLVFDSIYKEYAEILKQSIDQHPSETIFMKFDDGWVWVDVNANVTIGGRGGPEALYMRHCGNEYTRQPPAQDIYPHKLDRVYSLREPITIKAFNQNRWKPHITAVLNRDTLIEMKGYANSKPAPEFYKYIVPFIMSDLVKKIDSQYSHASENSFSIYSLPAEQMKKIKEVKGEKFELDLVEQAKENIKRWISEYNPRMKHTKWELQDRILARIITYDFNHLDLVKKLDKYLESLIPAFAEHNFHNYAGDLVEIKNNIITFTKNYEAFNSIHEGMIRNELDAEKNYYEQDYATLEKFIQKSGYTKLTQKDKLIVEIEKRIEEMDTSWLSYHHPYVYLEFLFYLKRNKHMIGWRNRSQTSEQLEQFFENNLGLLDQMFNVHVSDETNQQQFQFKEAENTGSKMFSKCGVRIASDREKITIRITLIVKPLTQLSVPLLRQVSAILESFDQNYQRYITEFNDLIIARLNDYIARKYRSAQRGTEVGLEYRYDTPLYIISPSKSLKYRKWYLNQLQRRYGQPPLENNPEEIQQL